MKAASDPIDAASSSEPHPSSHPLAGRILAIATNPDSGASTRFRVLQWRPYLEQAGFTLSLDAFYSPAAAAVLYQPGRPLSKLAHFAAGTVRRGLSMACASRTSDVLFIHREAFPFGRRLFFRALRRFRGPILYDYDDAMFLSQRRDRRLLAWCEDLDTPKAVMALSHIVLAGNRFLADYARRYARRVVMLPTCVDTQRFSPALRRDASRRPLTIGWIGSHSTTKYLQGLSAVLERVAGRTPFQLYVVGSASRMTLRGVDVRHVPWTMAREAEDFSSCDIGVYPLWDDPWAQGKCGFKALQFMACGVPVVASAVGMNRDIIEDGVNGYLASSEAEWVEKLARLLASEELRSRLGQQGRRTVEDRFAVTAHAPTLVSALSSAIREHRGGS